MGDMCVISIGGDMCVFLQIGVCGYVGECREVCTWMHVYGDCVCVVVGTVEDGLMTVQMCGCMTGGGVLVKRWEWMAG